MGKETELRELIAKSGKYDDADIAKMRELVSVVRSLGTDDRDHLSLRLSVELIDAIRRFDNATAKLVTMTNCLTGVILILTLVGVILAVLALRRT